MKSPENNLNNPTEQNEQLNQSPESQESLESAEDMQKRLSQEITTKNEELKQEDTKIETANNSIGLSNEEVQAEKDAMNLNSEISNINSEAEKLTNESKQELNSETSSKTVERPPIPPLPEKKKVEETAEKTPEQIEAEKLKAELENLKTNYQELAKQRDAIQAKIDEIKTQKGYSKELATAESSKIVPEQILSSVLPNKSRGLENLKKMLAATAHESDKEGVQKLIRKVESLSEQDVKDLSQNLSYEWQGIRASNLRNDSIDYADLGKITGSEEVKNMVYSYEATKKKVAGIEDKIKNDPDISANENQKAELTKQLADETDKIMRMEHKIQSLENPKVEAPVEQAV